MKHLGDCCRGGILKSGKAKQSENGTEHEKKIACHRQ
jgi:hypothetical protein